MALSLCLSFFLSHSNPWTHTHTPKAWTWPHSSGYRERTESGIVGPIRLILFPKSLYWADQAWFSRLLGCLFLHRCIRRKTCVGDVRATRVGERRLLNINHTTEQANCPKTVECTKTRLERQNINGTSHWGQRIYSMSGLQIFSGNWVKTFLFSY